MNETQKISYMALNTCESGVDGSKSKVAPENKSYLIINPAGKGNYF